MPVDGLIFTAPEGGPIRRNTFRSRFWLPAVADSVAQPMRFHDLRHSHVALLIAHGAPRPSSPPAWDTRASRPSSTSTGTSTKAATATPPTPSTYPGTDLMWAHRGRDAHEAGTKEGAELRNPANIWVPGVGAGGIEPPTSAV